MRKYKEWVIGVSILLLTIIGGTTEVGAQSYWADFDARTEPSEGVTLESIKARFEKYGRTHSPLYKNAEWIMEETKKRGINVAYFMSIVILESGWGVESNALKHNNFGGMMYKGKLITYESERAGLLANITLLQEYVEKGKVTSTNPTGARMITMKEITPVYCAASDGCNHVQYMTNVTSLMKNFGQEFKGEAMSATMSDKEREESLADIRDDEGRVLPIDELYLGRDNVEGAYVGVKDGQEVIGNGESVWFRHISEKALYRMYVIGWVLSAVLILYMVVYAMVYITIARGSHLQDYFPEKVVEKGREVYATGLQGIKTMAVRAVFVIILVAIFGTGAYIQMMSLAVETVMKLFT